MYFGGGDGQALHILWRGTDNHNMYFGGGTDNLDIYFGGGRTTLIYSLEGGDRKPLYLSNRITKPN